MACGLGLRGDDGALPAVCSAADLEVLGAMMEADAAAQIRTPPETKATLETSATKSLYNILQDVGTIRRRSWVPSPRRLPMITREFCNTKSCDGRLIGAWAVRMSVLPDADQM
jgi:hypothetical protein